MSQEATLRRQIAGWAKRNGYLCIPYPNTGYGIKGFPDLILIGHGEVLFVEAKRPGGKTSAKQEQWLEKLRSKGATAIVAECVEDIELATSSRTRGS